MDLKVMEMILVEVAMEEETLVEEQDHMEVTSEAEGALLEETSAEEEEVTSLMKV